MVDINVHIIMGRKEDELRKHKRASSPMSQTIGQRVNKMSKLAAGTIKIHTPDGGKLNTHFILTG